MSQPSRELTRAQFLIAGAGLAAGVLTGCGGSDSVGAIDFGTGTGYEGGRVDLAFWNGFTGGDGPQMLALVDEFQKENPNVRVKMVTVRWEDYYQKVPAAVQSGKGPEVGLMHVDQLATAAAHQAILPLNDLAESLQLNAEDYPGPVWTAGEYEGNRYGIPLDIHPVGLYQNHAALEKAGLDPSRPPQNREDYEGALEELKQAGIRGHWVSPFFFLGGLQFQSLLWQFGGDLTNEDASAAAWNSDAGVEAMEWMRSLVRKGYSPDNIGQDADNVAFKNAQAAYIWNGSWAIGDYGSTEGLEWSAAPVPQIGSEQGAWANSHQFVVMRGSEREEDVLPAAKALIDYITKSPKWAEAGQVPARTAARETPEFRKLEAQNQLAKQVPYVRFPQGIPGITDVRESTLDIAIAEGLSGRKPVREALDDSAKRAGDLLKDNLEKYRA